MGTRWLLLVSNTIGVTPPEKTRCSGFLIPDDCSLNPAFVPCCRIL